MIKKILVRGLGLLVAVCLSNLHAAEGISGAGSSAAAPVYKIWAEEYRKSGGEIISYDPVGSSAGMQRIRQNLVDFGASDSIASSADLAKDGLVMFPTVVSGVVPVVNLPRLGGSLRLTGDLLARIYLAEITQWNAPEIVALNPGLSLPSQPIRVICRADGSGTTYHFSDYLSKVSATWKARFGVASKHEWPVSFVAVKGSSEVVNAVRTTPGAIGYVDYNYALDNQLAGIRLRNAAGIFVAASPESFRSAVVRSDWFTRGDFSQTLTNLQGRESWPIAMGTYVAMPKVASNTTQAAKTLRFFAWAYANGDMLAKQAHFIPLPEKVQGRAFREISSILGSKGELIGVGALTILATGGN